MYYIRIHRGDKQTNLLSQRSDPEGVMYLVRQYGSAEGVVMYYDHKECSVVMQRLDDVDEIRVYQYDGEAPYDGYYMGREFYPAFERGGL